MENSYGIGVTNRYALFLDDDADPLEVLKVREQEKELKKKTKVAEKENKEKKVTKVAPVPRKGIKETPNLKPQDIKREDVKPVQRTSTENRPERKFNNENREERNNRRNREDRPFNNGPTDGNRDREDRPPRRDLADNRGDNFENRTRGERGGGGGGADRGGRPVGNRDRQPRGGPRGRNSYDQRGKREFDRQSGSDKTHGYSGVKPVDKREGGGAHNWGSHKDVIEEQGDNKPDLEIDTTWGEQPEKTENKSVTVEAKVEGGESGAADATTPATETAPVEEEPKELTLDEWKAQKAGRAKPQYNLRKAGEGEDPSQWKKMYALNKKKEGEEEESDDEEYDASEYPQRVGRQKHVLEIDIHFNDLRRSGGGGRGGRGSRAGPRGARPTRGGGGGGGGGGDRESRGGGSGAGGPGTGDRPARSFRGGGAGGGAGGGVGSGEPDAGEADAPRNDQVTRGGNRQSAPKVDDEHDFPSLG